MHPFRNTRHPLINYSGPQFIRAERHIFDNRSVAGLTLIEVALVTALIAILTTQVVGSWRDAIKDNRLAERIALLKSSFSVARSAAVDTYKSSVVVCTSSDGTQCSSSATWMDGWIVFSDLNGDNQLNGNDDLIRFQNGFDDSAISIGLIGSNSGKDRVIFNPDGSVQPSRAFVACDDRGIDLGRVVVINQAGLSKVLKKRFDAATLQAHHLTLTGSTSNAC